MISVVLSMLTVYALANRVLHWMPSLFFLVGMAFLFINICLESYDAQGLLGDSECFHNCGVMPFMAFVCIM